MQKTRKGWDMLLVSALALGVGSAPAIAQSTDFLAAADPVADPVVVAPALETPYTYADLFSIAFPAGWQVSEQADTPQVVAAGVASSTLPAIRTEVVWRDTPPGEVVGAALQEIENNGYTVARYDATTIDGVTAIRLWLSELPTEFPNAFITYVGYPGATATITSYYGDTTADPSPVLNAIHQSFQRSR